MIKTFEEYQVSREQLFETKKAYDAGVAEASAHFEKESIATHEYYADQAKKLAGNTEEKEVPDETNAGKLT